MSSTRLNTNLKQSFGLAVLLADGKVEKIKNESQKKWCSLHSSTSHLNQESFQQRSSSKRKDSSTVDGRNSEEHETYVIGSTTVDCKLCSSNDKVARKSNENKAECSPSQV